MLLKKKKDFRETARTDELNYINIFQWTNTLETELPIDSQNFN